MTGAKGPAGRAALYTGIGVAATVAALAVGLAALDEEAATGGGGPDGEGAGMPPDAPVTAAGTIDKSRFRQAPALAGIAAYINTAGAGELAAEIDGKVVLYDIWTYSCINCVRTLPHLTAWAEKYAGDGLVVVGVHSPEFEFEKDESNVRRAVEKHGIGYPVVMDNDMETWDAFKNRYWPHRFLADHEGYIRYDHIGEGAYPETERVLQGLLAERSAALGTFGAGEGPAPGGASDAAGRDLVDLEAFEHTRFMTPELYLGHAFAYGRSHLGNAEGFSPGADVEYALPAEAGGRRDLFYVGGTWANEEGHMRLASESGSIVLRYYAKEVNIVAGGDAEIVVTIDGRPVPEGLRGSDMAVAAAPGAPAGGQAPGDGAGAPAAATVVPVAGHDLYNVVSGGQAEEHVLRIDAKGPGLAVYTFTFG